MPRHFLRSLLMSGALCSLTLASADPAGAPATPAARDGQHDFDFNLGTWHTHIRRVLDPFTAGSRVIELNGMVTVRTVWDGRAQLEEIEADGAMGHWEGMTLFLYNPAARQWSQSFTNSKMGVLNAPLIGAFHDGRGELFAQDTFHERSILVRGVWSDIKRDSHRYEEFYSNDGGRTWLLALSAELRRQGT